VPTGCTRAGAASRARQKGNELGLAHTLLLVDDEYGALEVLALLMKLEGFDVLTASDGEDALARLRDKRPDLVITDYWMPRMDGLELCRRMQAHDDWRSIPIVMLTAIYDPTDLAATPGLTRILRKPGHFPQIVDVVRELLAGGARSDG